MKGITTRGGEDVSTFTKNRDIICIVQVRILNPFLYVIDPETIVSILPPSGPASRNHEYTVYVFFFMYMFFFQKSWSPLQD